MRTKSRLRRYLGRHAEIEGGFGGVFDDRRPVFLRERQHAEDATDPGFAVMPVDVIADGADRGSDPHGRFEQRHRLRRCPSRAIGIGERRPPVPLTLKQVDPLIRPLTLYRDLIDRTGDAP